MHLVNKYMGRVTFLLGFFSALPFFFIPQKPFVYINKIYSNNIWIDQNIIPYPGYTDSLGLAYPFILIMITIFFFCNNTDYKKDLKLIILGGCMVITNAIILYTLSSSLKSLSASSSLMGMYMISILIKKDSFNVFCKGFLISLVFFINLHALSLLVSGIKFSFASEGISIFGIEIYQSLVSYVTLVSFFFGTLLFKKNILHFSSIYEKKKIDNVIYFITLFSCLIIIIFLSRRLAFLICLFYIFSWLTFNLNNIKKKFPSSVYFIVVCVFSVLFFINKYFFIGTRGINYESMIKPRLDFIHKKINEIFKGDDLDLYLGSMQGWGNIENGYLDILLNSGIVGFFSVLSTFTVLTYIIYKTFNILVIRENIYYISSSFFVLFFTGIVNNPISTPYFFISFFLIMITVLSKKMKKI